ncbi:unnamed protein product [Acanthosepion pharaonis]|uniref:Uncharacterized protein n=1 Tax=Acanthosepion pharaonis TaxID=158019 RepID=A0A812BP59_ACAPH|nr:unnamed protein product [Sepia pharaonis]
MPVFLHLLLFYPHLSVYLLITFHLSMCLSDITVLCLFWHPFVLQNLSTLLTAVHLSRPPVSISSQPSICPVRRLDLITAVHLSRPPVSISSFVPSARLDLITAVHLSRPPVSISSQPSICPVRPSRSHHSRPFVPSARLDLITAVHLSRPPVSISSQPSICPVRPSRSHHSRPFVPSARLAHHSRPFVPSARLDLITAVHLSRPPVSIFPQPSICPVRLSRYSPSRPFVRLS